MKTANYSPKRKSIFNKHAVMEWNKSFLQSVSGGKLPDDAENLRTANKLGRLIVIFLLVQFFIVVALVFKEIGV